MENRLLIAFRTGMSGDLVRDLAIGVGWTDKITVALLRNALKVLGEGDITHVIAQLGTYEELNNKLPGLAVADEAVRMRILIENILITTAQPALAPSNSKYKIVEFGSEGITEFLSAKISR